MLIDGHMAASGRQTMWPELARWGWMSPHVGKRLRVDNPRQVAMVQLLPGSTARSFGLSVLKIFEGPASRCVSTSQVWSRVLEHFSRGRFQMLMIAGVEHLADGSDGNQTRKSVEIREALKSLLNQGIYIACIGPQAGVRFLLNDPQLDVRCVGSWDFLSEASPHG